LKRKNKEYNIMDNEETQKTQNIYYIVEVFHIGKVSPFIINNLLSLKKAISVAVEAIQQLGHGTANVVTRNPKRTKFIAEVIYSPKADKRFQILWTDIKAAESIDISKLPNLNKREKGFLFRLKSK